MIGRVIAAVIGTVAFSVLFSVPRKNYAVCGLIGGLGWLAYELLVGYGDFTMTAATFGATVVVVMSSRIGAVLCRCPAQIFVIPGIFPLVPGAGIYWTAYYLVIGEMESAGESGFNALKAAFAIVFGIVVVFELPERVFHGRLREKKQPPR